MDIGKDKLELIVRKTVAELMSRFKALGLEPMRSIPGAVRPDQSGYKTPILSLSMVERLPSGGTVAVSPGTVVSPMAMERLAEKRIKIVRER